MSRFRALVLTLTLAKSMQGCRHKPRKWGNPTHWQFLPDVCPKNNHLEGEFTIEGKLNQPLPRTEKDLEKRRGLFGTYR